MRALMPVALVFALLTGCESGPAALPDGGVVMPDLTSDRAPAPAFCHAVACLPPACCGKACTDDSQCCGGTYCASGRCDPTACLTCGELGCVVDKATCSGTCAKPQCCLAACVTNGDCCPATSCLPDTNKVRRCMPKACDACVGFRPICDVSGGCGITCRPPPECGMKCAFDSECGAHGLCRKFLDGSLACVPAVFDTMCNGCGQPGCLFHSDSCTIECAPTPHADLGAGVGDAGSDSDGGTAVIDAAAPADAAGSTGCKSCCAGCAKDSDCCGNQRCQPDGKGHTVCTPAECQQCPFGCRFYCP